MFVKLIGYTNENELVPAIAGKLCYSKGGYKGIIEKLDRDKIGKFLQDKVEIGHLSIIEHISFSYIAEGVSRSLTHQLVRHRIASFSQQSQRYVGAEDFEYVVPDSIKKTPGALTEYKAVMEHIRVEYEKLIKTGVPKEDARYLLPNAAETKIVVTMNARELLHFFNLRLCNRAQWEIRELAGKMLVQAKKVSPDIFKDAGPACVSGKCSEGRMTCGKSAEMRKKYRG
jgi:thymidylate synthase (FAD)